MAYPSRLLSRWSVCSFAVSLLVLSGRIVLAQQTAPATTATQPEALDASIRELQEQVRELRTAVGEMRAESARYHAENLELRREIQATKARLGASGATQNAFPTQYIIASLSPLANSNGLPQEQTQTKSVEERLVRLEEESQLQSSKIDEQYQTKVESASRYRVRLSGIALLNLFSNRGTVDNQDIPNIATVPSAFDAKGNFGGTLRQSEIGLEVFGPRLGGARTTGDIQFDLGGGFPSTYNGVTSGLFRLRTGTIRMDWSHTSIVAGQDNIFFSPLSPTSFASLIVPAFGYAGNLWAWVPQVRVERRFEISADSSVTLQGGILDNLTGEPPAFQAHRVPQAGERSSQPGYAVRVSGSRSVFGQPMTFGLGGYYSRQDWAFNRHADGWAGTSDWEIPLGRLFGLSGEFYIGDAVGGLGGGIGNSIVQSGPLTDPATRIRTVDSLGGWSQIKFKPTSRWEFNGAFGLDNARADDLRTFPASQSNPGSTPARNQGAFVNFIYRPYSNLLFSGEYRRLRTFQINGNSATADQVNLMMGILF